MFSDAIRSTVKDTCHLLRPRPKDMNSREDSMVKMTGDRPAEHYEYGAGQSECEKTFGESFDAEMKGKRMLSVKARMCYKWKLKGQCAYRKNCRFAHGLAEMIDMHVKTDSLSPFITNTNIRKLEGYSSADYNRVMLTSVATTNASTATVSSDTLPNKELYGTKCIFKRNELQKISRIYADWIEGVSHRAQVG